MEIIARHPRRLRIAVVGTGIAGMSAAWLLDQSHDVTVYERDGWVGGHAHTVEVPGPDGGVPVDTGFIVYNETNYPNLTALFHHLGVATAPSDMSFAASLDGGRFEYSGSGLDGLLGQRANALRPRFWRMLSGILRFYREAPGYLAGRPDPALTLGDYLRAAGYPEAFIRDHLLPMGAAIWSATAPEMLSYPAAAFIRFFESHGLLKLRDRPQWRTVAGGSREYVRRLTANFADRIRPVGVASVRRTPNEVFVTDARGDTERFDHVVISAHADQALRLLADADPIEARLLGAWQYTDNRAVLHHDPSLMPRQRRVWSSWNFIDGAGAGDAALCVTYWMNRLQPLATDREMFLTLNPVAEPAAESVVAEFSYSHPLFDTAALATQPELWSLQGRRRSWFCGSYFGYGFHEDALQSGLAVAEELGGLQRPWTVPGQNDRLVIPEAAQAESA